MKIKIWKTIYEVEFKDKVSMGNGRAIGLTHSSATNEPGNIRRRKNIIEVQKGENQEHILFHEVVHALLNELGKKRKYLDRLVKRCNNDEHFVDGMASLMTDCFKIKEVKE